MKQANPPRSTHLGESPPVRRRGLKLSSIEEKAFSLFVASRAEAWIETPTPGKLFVAE